MQTATRGTNGRPTTADVDKMQLARENPIAALDLAMTKAAPRLAEIVPRHVDPMRVIQLAISNARRDPKLLECTTSSMLIATSQIAALGLEPGTALQQAYLVPRKNRRKVRDEGGREKWIDVHEATAIIGYRGLVLLAHDSEGIDVQAEVVHMADTFRERGGLAPILEHEKSEADDPGQMRGAYAVWELPSGKRRHLWWPRRDLVKHRDRFAPRSSYVDGQYIARVEDRPISGPWADHFEAMCAKTVVRAAAKLWPLSSDKMRHALRVDDAGERGAVAPFLPGVKPEAVAALVANMGEPEIADEGDYTDAPEVSAGEAAQGREPGED